MYFKGQKRFDQHYRVTKQLQQKEKQLQLQQKTLS
jgi:hypothetical protein